MINCNIIVLNNKPYDASRMSSTCNTKKLNLLPLNFQYTQSSTKFTSTSLEIILMNFVMSQMRDLFKNINRFIQFAYHRLQIILNMVFLLHRINYFINVFIQKHNLYIHLCKNNYQNDLQCHYSPEKIFLRNQRESFFVINVFLLVRLLATRKTLYISILLIEFLLTIDIYL